MGARHEDSPTFRMLTAIIDEEENIRTELLQPLLHVGETQQVTSCERRWSRLLGMPPLASPRYRLRSSSSSRSSTRFTTTHSLHYDFMPMPGLPPSPSPPRLYTTSSSRLQSRRWEGVLYSVRFAFPRPSSLALGTFPEEQDFSLKFAGVLSLAGLAATGTVDFRL